MLLTSLRRKLALGRKLALLRSIPKTLFIRHLDNHPDVVIASAIADAERRGISSICLFLSYSADPDLLRQLLTHPRIGCVGTKDRIEESLLPHDLKNDPRVGRYWEPGDWILPTWPAHVYFVGPWRLVTAAMLREAIRRGAPTLRVRVAHFWVSIPVNAVRRLHQRAPFLWPLLRRLAWWAQSVPRQGRRWVARGLLLLRPGAVEAAARIAGPESLGAAALQHAFARLTAIKADFDAVPRRVVHVCGNLQPGGAERQLVYTLKGLSRRNLESVQLLCHNLTQGAAGRCDFYLPALQEANIGAREIRRRTTAADYSGLPAQVRNIAALVPAHLMIDICDLFWEFTELRPEIVHGWLDWDNVRAGIAAVLAGVPKVILSCRNINPSNFSLYQPYMDPAYRALVRLPTVTIINNSRAGADNYADWIGIGRNRIRVIHNGVDFGEHGRLSAEEAAALRRSYDIPVDAFVVGGVFRLEEEKRPLLWVEAACRVLREVANAWFLVFGQGHMRDQMLRKARQLGLQERFVLAGVTADVLSAMSTMDVLFLTSRGEGLPNVLLEAQWVGTPVVTTDVGGAKEAIEAGVTGWSIASDQPLALARQIVALYRDPATLAAARRRGPIFVREQFGVARMVSQTMNVYGYEHAPDIQVFDDGATAGHARKG